MLALLKNAKNVRYAVKVVMVYTKKNYLIIHHYIHENGYIFIKCKSAEEAEEIVQSFFSEEKIDLTAYHADGLPSI